MPNARDLRVPCPACGRKVRRRKDGSFAYHTTLEPPRGSAQVCQLSEHVPDERDPMPRPEA